MRSQATAILCEGYTYRDVSWRRVVAVLSGIVFLGTPHVTHNNVSAWDQLPLLLQSLSKTRLSDKKIALLKDFTLLVPQITEKFDHQAKTTLDILTAYESKPSRTGIFTTRNSVWVSCTAFSICLAW